MNHLIGHPGKPKLPGSELITSTVGGTLPTFGPVGTLPFGRAWDPVARKAKPAAHLTVENWMLEYARMIRDENTKFVSIRRGNVGQVQVGLNVEENEEDCYEMVEEEYTDDEDVESLAAAVKAEPTPGPAMPDAAPQPMQVDPAFASQPAAATPSIPTEFPGLPALPPLASTSSAAPSPLSHGHLPPLHAPPPAAAPTPPPPRPKKRRMVRSYVPIRGLYDPETNVPHVYQATQARNVVAYERASKYPRLEGDEVSPPTPARASATSSEDADSARRRAAARAGIASVDVLSDERAWSLETGGRSIDDAIEGRRGREPLMPGMWDFLELARKEGIPV